MDTTRTGIARVYDYNLGARPTTTSPGRHFNQYEYTHFVSADLTEERPVIGGVGYKRPATAAW